MGKLKKLQLFLSRLFKKEANLVDSLDLATKPNFVRIKPSPLSGSVQAGRLYMFKYKPSLRYPNPTGESHLVFCTRNKKGRGLFITSQKNICLTGFKVNSMSTEVLNSILKIVYNNRNVSYLGIRSLIGYRNFRWYDIEKIYQFNEVELRYGK